ncbi:MULTISPECIES: hypothetical protein [Desulfitobacterium]|uniref:Uncharacterized protein n=1 Tax=Desulfitobacterium dehalogenans (strain ATCC 51507 / DSM 9161 / JW/IU-DC1) TaxID=756499 RepID=I4AAH3_DESDJ|nr:MULTISPECIES: hypothetical protein [Desulfitobacterium]AFM00958.1 hypothetical protein Desde_2639 [Desulfitobacterium dehalogenans ATCC 51507]
MTVSKKLSLTGVFMVIAFAIVLLFGSLNYLSADSDYTELEASHMDLAVKSFGIETDKVKALYAGDVFKDNNKGTVFSTDKVTEDQSKRVRCAAALSELRKAKLFNIGDYRPVFFLGEDKVSIAIKHGDGTISLTDVDISKDRPVIIDHKVKEVAE